MGFLFIFTYYFIYLLFCRKRETMHAFELGGGCGGGAAEKNLKQIPC